MHVSVNSASNAMAALSSNLAARTASSAAASRANSDSFSSAAAGQRPPPPGPPPSGSSASGSSDFNLQMSTSQFASLSGADASSTPPAPKDFGAMDSDGDGSVSASEYGLDAASERDSQLFAGIDQDSDGSLSGEEVADFESKMAQQGGPGGARGPGGAGQGEDPFAALDSDSDGNVSSEEFGLSSATEEVQQLFKAIDSDADGSLSSDEVSSFKESMASTMDGAQGTGRPHGPPPGPPPGADSSSSDSSEEDSSDASETERLQQAAKSDVSALLQRLAEQYLGSQLGGSTQSSLSLSA